MSRSHETPEHLEHRVTTPDGRTLAVAEWGDPNGVPVIAMHGTPGGRIAYWEDPAIYARHGLRRLTYDRPGYGESTRLRGRTVSDVTVDVAAIADALGFDRFAVTGGSGGGPHALATAAQMPDRVIRCLIASCPAPWDAGGLDWMAGQTQGNIIEWQAAQRGDAAIRAVVEVERRTTLARLQSGRADFLGDSYEMSEADVRQMQKHVRLVIDQLVNGLVHGVDGWVDDDIAFVCPWGVDLGSIAAPMYITYGRTDTLVPAAHGDWLASHFPRAIVVAGDAGHLGDDETVDRELAWLAGDVD